LKLHLTLALAIALIVDLVVFFGVGFGTGSLCTVAQAGCTPGGTLSQTTNGPGGIMFQVAFGQAPNNGFYTSDYNSNGTSTPISWNLQTFVGNNSCTQGPGWEVGSTFDYGWYQIFLTYQGSLLPIVAQGAAGLSAGPSNGNAYSYYTVSENSSATQSAYCYGGGAQSSGGSFYLTTIALQGTYQDYSVLHVRFFTETRYCNSAFQFSRIPQCTLGGNSLGQTGSPWQGNAEGQIFVRSGYTAMFPQQGVAYNGGTLSVPYSTGYDAGTGYSMTFNYGPCRPNAMGVIQTLTLVQSTLGVATFNVPQGLAQLTNTTCAPPFTYNEFYVILYSGQFPLAWISRQLVDVSPSTAPGVPQISLTDATGHSPAQVGDTIVMTFNASYTAAGGKISTFNVAGFYNVPGVPTPPVQAQYWIAGNAQGSNVAATCSGNASFGVCTGTYRFQLTYLDDVTVTVQDITTLNQGNQNVVTLQVTPSGCASATCNGLPAGLWQWVGPLTLVVAIALSVSLLVFWVPLPIQFRIIALGVTLIALAVLYGPISGLFVPGGPL
jgi:hypothetical protein